MTGPGIKTIHSAHHHCGWDNSLTPVLTVAPGETIRFECLDAAGGFYDANSTAADIARMDSDKVNPVTGPIFVDGSEPGDCLKVTIGDFEPSGFGWSAIIPGFGLLADQFTEPRLHLWNYDRAVSAPAAFGDHARVPLKPFAGTMGVAMREPGNHSVIPPRHVGGNLDVRDIASSSELYLPVEVAGALFSVGDTHAAQGDGEVCGTAIESAMNVTMTFDLIKGKAPPAPRFVTPGPVSRHLDSAGYDVTTGVGPDLMAAAGDAVSAMVDLISAQQAIPAEDAYILCSVCGDLRISEVVDAPNWVVSFYFPRIVWE